MRKPGDNGPFLRRVTVEEVLSVFVARAHGSSNLGAQVEWCASTRRPDGSGKRLTYADVQLAAEAAPEAEVEDDSEETQRASDGQDATIPRTKEEDVGNVSPPTAKVTRTPWRGIERAFEEREDYVSVQRCLDDLARKDDVKGDAPYLRHCAKHLDRTIGAVIVIVLRAYGQWATASYQIWEKHQKEFPIIQLVPERAFIAISKELHRLDVNRSYAVRQHSGFGGVFDNEYRGHSVGHHLTHGEAVYEEALATLHRHVVAWNRRFPRAPKRAPATYMSVTEAARRTQTPVRTVRQWCTDGRLPAYKRGDRWVIAYERKPRSA
jgi:excisionase family DNA binding protein